MHINSTVILHKKIRRIPTNNKTPVLGKTVPKTGEKFCVKVLRSVVENVEKFN